jgi:hypothetical protein
MSDPIGIRQNNPGNLELRAWRWSGQLPPQKGDRFCRFETPRAGIRAMALNVRNQKRNHGILTIQGLIDRYAPGVENNVTAYVQSVAKRSGLPPDVPINFDAAPTLEKIIPAMIHHENGRQPYPMELIKESVKLAMEEK